MVQNDHSGPLQGKIISLRNSSMFLCDPSVYFKFFLRLHRELTFQTGKCPKSLPLLLLLKTVLRDLHQLPVFQSGLVSHNSGNGQVKRHSDINQGFTVLQDRSYEFIHQIPVRTTMTPRRHTGWQGRPLQVR